MKNIRRGKKMRIYKLLAFLISLSVLLVPLTSLKKEPAEENLTKNNAQTDGQTAPVKLQTVKVYITKTQETVEIELEEYLLGVLAAEMPATYHEEALKAQAVAAYTYLLNKRKNPDEALGGADLSDNSATHQGYLTATARNEKWGDKTEAYEKKLKKSVQEVMGKVIVYEGEPIIAAFHAINSGVTQSAKTVWGGEVPYLKSVNSVGDRLSPDCVKTVAISSTEFSNLASNIDSCTLDGEAESWIGDIETSSDGYVKTVEIGSAELTGLEARDALGLRSAVFTYEYKDDNFMFTTSGYGHCVGMSQYGADYMARQGSTWEEIIKHYYTGVTVE